MCQRAKWKKITRYLLNHFPSMKGENCERATWERMRGGLKTNQLFCWESSDNRSPVPDDPHASIYEECTRSKRLYSRLCYSLRRLPPLPPNNMASAVVFTVCVGKMKHRQVHVNNFAAGILKSRSSEGESVILF